MYVFSMKIIYNLLEDILIAKTRIIKLIIKLNIKYYIICYWKSYYYFLIPN